MPEASARLLVILLQLGQSQGPWATWETNYMARKNNQFVQHHFISFYIPVEWT